jgi:hypothetical protein
MHGTLLAVRTSAESGVLRKLLTDALRLYRFVNDDANLHGFRLIALTRFEAYASADKRVNLLQCGGGPRSKRPQAPPAADGCACVRGSSTGSLRATCTPRTRVF